MKGLGDQAIPGNRIDLQGVDHCSDHRIRTDFAAQLYSNMVMNRFCGIDRCFLRFRKFSTMPMDKWKGMRNPFLKRT